MDRRDCLALGLGGILASPLAFAQAFPTRPVRIVVPFSPGGAADVQVRVLAQRLTEDLKQSVLVENRPGGGTVIGTMSVANAPADGYTLLCVSNSFLLNSSMRAKPAYDAFADFVPVSMLTYSPNAIVVNRSHPATTLKAFLEWAAAKPGGATWAAVGPATSQHVMGEKLKGLAKVNMTYVPYPGGAPAVAALVGGHVDMAVQNLSEVIEQVRGGTLRALAVTTSERVETLKDVPTLEEAGLPGFELEVFFAFVARKGTPADAIARINAETRRALKSPAVRDKLVALSLFPRDQSAEELTEYMKANSAKFTAAAKAAGITLE